ncbi:F0F1 ATP synthase subunit epsilon [Coralliovum pocilloporae]|uniref:F0F1 ATP synthase subunit epsilon n=1 Tax=Coralliovum pocilloporae TaxID=3066369 RepID=UPI00330773AD
MANVFKFELVSPERLVLSAEVSEVVVPGSEGFFGVMKDHAPFVSTLSPGVLLAKTESGEEKKIFVRGGFAEIGSNGLTVLAEEAISVDELDAEAIASRIKNAEEDLADAQTDDARSEAALRLERLKDLQAAA